MTNRKPQRRPRIRRADLPEDSECHVRAYANHLALTVRNDGGRLTLRERYNDNGQNKRIIGVFRSWRGVLRGIEKYGDDTR